MVIIKIIFLDIDGVLNTQETFKRRKELYIMTGIWETKIDFYRVEYLKEIIEKTKAKIVLTSSWRKDFIKENNKLVPKNKNALELVEVFSKYNLEIYDISEIDINGKRQNEIRKWLLNNNVETFIIIDDENYDLEMFDDYIIKTRNNNKIQTGLCKEHIEIALDMLNKKKLVLKNNQYIK